MILYSYWRSSTAYRVRIALNLKGLEYKVRSVNLLGGEQTSDEYLALNPIGGVPTLVVDERTTITQSIAILEFLDAVHPEPALIPKEPYAAAQIRAATQVIASDIHPVNNSKVISHLKEMGHTQDAATSWMNHWMQKGLTAYQALLPNDATFSFSDMPTLADLCLIPQLYNAHRWGTDLTGLERLLEIETRCLQLPAFAAAHPDTQPDAN